MNSVERMDEAIFPPASWAELDEWFDWHVSLARRGRISSFSLPGESLDDCGSLDAIPELLREAEGPFAAEIEQATARLGRGAAAGWLEMSPPAAGLLVLRFETAELWLHTFRSRRDAPDPFAPVPFPAVDFADLLRWLLLEWWQDHGRQLAADEMALRHLWMG